MVLEKKDFSFYCEGMTDETFEEIASTRIPAKDHTEYWESPYFYDGITLGELEEETVYYAEHYKDYKKGDYIPLWKQRLAALQVLKYKNPMLTIGQFCRQNAASMF